MDEEAVERWAASKRAYTPGKLWEELTVIKTVALGVLRGMKEANEAGFRFEPDGSEGPFLGDVLLLDGKVKLVDTEPLGEFDEGEDRFFTAEPLVYSPLGEFFRSWWVGCADKIGMSIDGTKQCPDPKFQEVLNSFGTLNWLLFKWEREKLAGDEIIHMLVHGPQAAAEARYGRIETWDTSRITDMSYLFLFKGDFNADISWWNVGRVKDMHQMCELSTSAATLVLSAPRAALTSSPLPPSQQSNTPRRSTATCPSGTWGR